jgi:hypothetical protein
VESKKLINFWDLETLSPPLSEIYRTIKNRKTDLQKICCKSFEVCRNATIKARKSVCLSVQDMFHSTPFGTIKTKGQANLRFFLRQLGHAEVLSVPAAFRTLLTEGLALSGDHLFEKSL